MVGLLKLIPRGTDGRMGSASLRACSLRWLVFLRSMGTLNQCSGPLGVVSRVHEGTNLLEAARLNGSKRYFYASTACVYNEDLQLDPSNPGLKEGDAWPAKPQVGRRGRAASLWKGERERIESFGGLILVMSSREEPF